MASRVDADLLPHRVRPDHLTDQREDEGLGDGHDGKGVFGGADAVGVAAHPCQADPEQLWLHAGERRINARHRAFVVGGELLVGRVQ